MGLSHGEGELSYWSSSSWIQPRGRQPPIDYFLKTNIGLKRDRFGELLEHLYEVGDPEHRRYVFGHARISNAP